MKSGVVVAFAVVSLSFAATASAYAGDNSRHWCRHLQNPNSPMSWNEGFGVSSCNDRASTPYQPWNSAVPIRRNQNDPMVAREDWRGSSYFSAYDNRYDDRYDRRSHRYR
jgi:hypothetical protein